MPRQFSFSTSVEKMKRQFDLRVKTDLQTSYNIGVGQHAYVLTNQSSELQIFRWGMIPHWAKDEQAGLNLTHARANNIATQFSFRMPIRQKRCIIFADSFYEWKGKNKTAQPHRVQLKSNDLMAMAGVWDVWQNAAGQLFKTFAIITVPPNADLEALGSKQMPALLVNKEVQKKWLSDLPLANILELLTPLEEDRLNVYPISKDVNTLENNSPDLHTPI